MSAVVLIADADSGRAERLAEAFSLRGFAPRVVPNGAEALDAALAEVPDALVAAGKLDLIPVPKLTEILRANPRTQAVTWLLLGTPKEEQPDDEGWHGEALDADADVDVVAQRLEELLERSARLDELEREAGADQEVHGRLTQIPLPDLLQLFHMNRRTGVISLRRRTADGREERGRIHLRDGEVIQAVSGLVSAEKALFRLLTWADGSFSFRPEAVRLTARVSTPTRALLMEAMRQMDEWRELGPGLPSPEAEVALRVRRTELPNVVHPVTQEVLVLLEIYSRVRDIVDHSSFPDYQVLRTLQTLGERGLVEVRKEARPPAPDAGLLSRDQIRRLREYFAPAGRSPGPLRDAKVLLISPTEPATREFLKRLARAPGAELERRATRRSGAGQLGRAARVRVDTEVGIEFLHVPCGPSAAPLWPLAVHGALAVVVLLGNDPEASAEVLRPFLAAVHVRPRLRIVPVLLGHPGETAVPGDLRPVLAPYEDAAPVFLSGGEEAERGGSLRSLFARLVP